MPTATIDSAPSSGHRTEPDWATLHDIDDQRHLAVIDYPFVTYIVLIPIRLGCFQESWAKQLPVMCVNHDQTSLLGRAVAAESFPDSHRVIGKFSNFDDVPQARSAFASIRDGVFLAGVSTSSTAGASPTPTATGRLGATTRPG